MAGKKSNEQPVPDPDSSTVQREQRSRQMQDTQHRESSGHSSGRSVDQAGTESDFRSSDSSRSSFKAEEQSKGTKQKKKGNNKK